jgi:hypothetical protein
MFCTNLIPAGVASIEWSDDGPLGGVGDSQNDEEDDQQKKDEDQGHARGRFGGGFNARKPRTLPDPPKTLRLRAS